MPKSKELNQVGRKNAPTLQIVMEEDAVLLPFLITIFPDKSRTTIKSYLTNRQTLVNGQQVSKHDTVIKKGDILEINTGWIKRKSKLIGLRVVYEDNDIIVVEKEPGLLSIATADEKRNTAYSILSAYVKDQNPKNKIFVVHRLDRETSGLMLFAKNEGAQERLQASWKDSVEVRKYVALVEGKVDKQYATITSWLKEGKTFVVHACDYDNGGQKAVLHYRLIRTSFRHSLLDISLDTGRKNQIRVQLQSIGHPVVGDKKYGAQGNPIKRLALHAYCIEFIHPMTGESLRFETEIPQSFIK